MVDDDDDNNNNNNDNFVYYLFKCSQNIAKKSVDDADSFDDCQSSLSKLENRQRCQKPGSIIKTFLGRVLGTFK